MSDTVSIGHVLRHAFRVAPAVDLADLAGRADAALATVAAQPGLHPLMRATLTSLFGAAATARLIAGQPVNAVPVVVFEAAEARHGAGDELLYEYDPAEQARFEAACAREEAGED